MGRLSDAMRRAAERDESPNAPAAATVAAKPETDHAEPGTTIDQMFPPEHGARPSWPVDTPGEWGFEPAAEDVRPSDDELTTGSGTPAVDDQFGFDADLGAAQPEDQEAVQGVSVDTPPAAEADVKAAPAPTLFERVDLRYSGKVVVDETIAPVSREQYRRLAAALHHAQEASGIKVVMIASAVASEGKTLTASNLALTLSESYRRHVLLVDGDLRKPSLHTMFRVTGTPGLSEGLMSPVESKLPLRQVSSTLTLLTAGAASVDPMAGLTSSRMKRLIDEARAAFDWVIIDTPPVGLLTDASLLGAMVDGAVLVVRANATPYDLVQRAVESLGRDRVLGVVLNQSTIATPAQDYAHYYRTTPAAEAPEGA